MREEFIRTSLIMGEDAVEKLNKSHVAVFGVGGVGGFAVEALARSGIGALDLIDNDRICLSNINRQIIAAGLHFFQRLFTVCGGSGKIPCLRKA